MNEQFVYDLFSKAYYRKGFRRYNDDECSVTQTTTCLLKAFYDRKMRREFADRKKVILMWGTLLHRTIQKELVDEHFRIENETSMRFRDITLYGHSDAVNDISIFELKGVSRLPYEPLHHHALQTNAYLFLEDKKQAYIAYVHKSSGTVKLFTLIPNTEIFEYTKLRALRLCTHLQRNVIPQPEPSWECRYCEYTDICPTQGKGVSRSAGF